MIKAVLFDMDNTLHNLDAAVLAAADAVFCYCKEDFFSAVWNGGILLPGNLKQLTNTML